MRILVLSPGHNLEGGAERSARLLVEGLVQRGHDVIVLGVEGSATEAYGLVGARTRFIAETTADDTTLRHGGSAHFLVSATRALPRIAAVAGSLQRAVRVCEPDVIYSNGARTHILTTLIRTQVPIAWALRDVPPRHVQIVVLRTASRRADLLLANSRFTASHFDSDTARIEVVGNPVAPVQVSDRNHARTALGIPNAPKVIGLVAHLHPSKGHHIAIEALAHLPEKDRPFLAIAGGLQYPGSSVYLAGLERHIIRRGLEENVALLGAVGDMDVFYSAVDVLAHCAIHPEGFGRTVVEAWTAGVPVVATDIGGVSELCRGTEAAVLVPPDDVLALTSALVQVLSSEELRSTMVDAGRKESLRYLPEGHVNHVENLLGELVST